MRYMRTLTTAAIILAGLMPGCGDGETTSSGPKEPRDIIVAMLKSLGEGDAGAAVSHYLCSTEDKEYLTKTMPLKHATIRLDRIGAKTYGLDEWRAAKKSAAIEDIIPDVAGIENKLECTIVGNTAVCRPEGFGGVINLVKEGGKWVIIPARGQFPPLHHRGDILKAILARSAALEAIIQKIGSGGASAHEICDQVKNAMRSQ